MSAMSAMPAMPAMKQSQYNDPAKLPGPSANQVYVNVAALNGGFVTLPERLFVTNADPNKASTVPSMCFLIEHRALGAAKSELIVFDLGIKRNLTKYIPSTRAHIALRQPIYSTPDVRSSLLSGGLDPAKDIDYVVLSHIHWDHIGLPSDYPNSRFIVGSGTLYILENGAPCYPSDRMEKGALPVDRTHELPPTPDSDRKNMAATQKTDHQWQSLSALPNAIDFFGDGSMYIIDAPGHIHGHVNALLRIGPEKWVYLGGDCCHDPRILTGEKDIAEYDDEHGKLKSVHSELPVAKETIKNIMELIKTNGDAVEWIVAHDAGWAAGNQHRFFPNWMF
jgi:glyoxylase-like metal-dependent hydrolase (beta-lactamase superfamily II)